MRCQQRIGPNRGIAGFDRNLFSPEVIEASIDYMHRNPVER